MIKANELRIGNLINYRTDFNNTADLFVDIDVLSDIKKGNNKFEPIPLTEEWLIKFGFENVNNVEFRKRDYFFDIVRDGIFVYTIHEGYDGIQFMGDCDIKHVHQLQNLYFALTGEELTLKP